MSRHFNRAGLISIIYVSPYVSSSQTDWGEFSEAGFSADVIMERDCETV